VSRSLWVRLTNGCQHLDGAQVQGECYSHHVLNRDVSCPLAAVMPGEGELSELSSVAKCKEGFGV
jgi:hypothetical protein